MSIQRFTAPTAREALALARAAFGDDTLILSNRQLDHGVEVVAAAETALAALGHSTPSAQTQEAPPAVPQGASAPAMPAPHALTALTHAPDATTQQIVQADIEQLSMSTLSFQDYVRERMLRRQHEENEAAAAGKPAAPFPQWAAATPSRAAEPVVRKAPTTFEPRRPVAEASAFAMPQSTPSTPATPVPPSMPSQAASFASFQPAAAVQPHHQPQPSFDIPVRSSIDLPGPAPALQPAAESDITRVLMAELQAMKALMENRFNTLSWLGQARQDPIHSTLLLKLVRAGYSASLARLVLEALPLGPDAASALRDVSGALERQMHIDPHAPSLAEAGGVFALVGPTGVGKTTTAAKLAAQCVALHGASSVGLITLDTYRAGAHEQLRSHGRNIGVVAHLAHDRAALQELLQLFSGKHLVLVDTAGIAPRDPRRRELIDLLDLPGMQRLMVLNAGTHGDTLDEMATSFKVGGARGAILTKIDETVKLGPAIDTLIRHQLVLRGVANGPRVPQDWKAADAGELVRESLRATQRAPFDPRSGDLDLYLSPARCAV